MIFKSTEIANELFYTLHKKMLDRINENLEPLILHIILANDNLSSKKYTLKKQEMGRKLGINVMLHEFSQSDSSDFIIGSLYKNFIHKKSKTDKNTNGLIVQLPTQNQAVWENIKNNNLFLDDFVDVDLISGKGSNFLLGKGFLPPTISAIDIALQKMIEISNWKEKTLSGKNVAIIGQGVLVGSPLLHYLKDCKASIFSINEHTQNPENITNLCDIVICCAGVPALITSKYLKDGAIVIDAATSEAGGKLVGDLDLIELENSGKEKNILICPTPGGIGPLTVLCLFENLINICN